ncbi:MAG: hypothetical protein C0582_02195 [Alphaproteobacteria bacterium]|nr:MAG: hypothetical protein C0582_02195 [Alphaproteobacteria bacterium]
MRIVFSFLVLTKFLTMSVVAMPDMNDERTEEGQPVRKVLHPPKILEIKSYMGRQAAIFFQSEPQHVVINESVLSQGIFPVIERCIQRVRASPEVQRGYQQELMAGRNPFDQESIYQRVRAAVLQKRGVGVGLGQGKNAGKLCFICPYNVDKSPLFFEEATEQEVEAMKQSRLDDLDPELFTIAQFVVSKNQPPLAFKLSVSGLREHSRH